MTTTFTIPFVPDDSQTIEYFSLTVELTESIQEYTRTETPADSMIDTRSITEVLETDFGVIEPHIEGVFSEKFGTITKSELESLITEDKIRLIY